MNKKKILNVVIGLGILILLWILASLLSKSGNTIIPSPKDVFQAFNELSEGGLLFEYIGISLYRFFVGYILSVVTAILLGLIMGWYTKIWDVVDPIVQVLRPISPTAWFPFIVIAFGIGNLPAIVIIFIAGFFPVLLSTVSAVKKIDKTYLKVAGNFEIKGLSLMTKIVIPAIFPYIANAMHIALGTSWIFLVAGASNHDIKDMPFALVSPEWSNEKGIGAALAFRLFGVNSYHCVEAPVQGSENVSEFLKNGTKEILGSTMNVVVDPKGLAHKIIDDFKEF